MIRCSPSGKGQSGRQHGGFLRVGRGWVEIVHWGCHGSLSHGTSSKHERFPDTHGREFNPKQRTEPFWKEKPEKKTNKNAGSQEEKYFALSWSVACIKGTAHRRKWITGCSSFL